MERRPLEGALAGTTTPMPPYAELAATLPASLAAHLSTARELAEERREVAAEERLETASALDRLLAGGLCRGALVELVGRRSSGRFSLVLAALAAATATGEAAALVDLGDGLEPRAAEAAGVDLERLLWVRPRRMREALASTEAILSSGMPLVVLEVGMPPVTGGRGAESAWLRLARAARDQETALLVASPYRVSGTAAAVVVEARGRRSRWCGRGLSPRLLEGLDPRLELLKAPGARPGRDEGFALRSAEAIPRPEPARGAPPAEVSGHKVLPFVRRAG